MDKECLLCLELNQDNYLDAYEAKSSEYHIVSLIEKYLWPMSSIKSKSKWLCSMCCKSLLEFHRFYRRIEDVQSYFDHVVTSEHIKIEKSELYEYEIETVRGNIVKNEFSDAESKERSNKNDCDLHSLLNNENDGGEKQNQKYFNKYLRNSKESQNESSTEINTNFVSDLFKCHVCDKLFTNQKVLEKHTAWHQNTVCSCEICDLKFFDLSTLIQHKRSHATNGKSLKLANVSGVMANQEETNDSFISFSREDFEYMESHAEQDTSSETLKSDTFPLACSYCSKVIVSQETMEKHIAWHKGNIKKCNLCDLQFINVEKYNIHYLAHKMKVRHVALERGFQCKYCINIYDDKQAYLNHISRHEDKIYYCTICDLEFLNASKFYHHKSSSHDLNNIQTFDTNSGTDVSQYEEKLTVGNNPYQEEKRCIKSKKKKSKRYKQNSEIVENKQEENNNHLQVIAEETDFSLNEVKHSDTIDAQESELSRGDNLQLIEVECPFCFKVLENERFLLNHKAWHEDNVFHCKKCELKFFDKAVYENHYAAHDDEVEEKDNNIELEYFMCSICSKVLKSRRLFLNHNAWHTGTIYTCEICDLQFLDKIKYEDHQDTHLPKSWKRCRDCGKVFACASHVIRHWEKIHRNKFIKICDVCGMVYRCALSFRRHTDQHRGQLENTRIPCDICGKLLKGKAGLKSHKLINHPENGIHPYVCHICLKPIATRALLTTHFNQRHGPNDSQYKCLVCDKTFRTYTHLKKHSDVHSTEAKYTCQWCPEKFYRSTALSRHRRKLHPNEYAEWKSNLYVQV